MLPPLTSYEFLAYLEGLAGIALACGISSMMARPNDDIVLIDEDHHRCLVTKDGVYPIFRLHTSSIQKDNKSGLQCFMTYPNLSDGILHCPHSHRVQ